MSRKPALWVLAWLLPLPILVSAAAPVAAQTLDNFGRPLSPAEGRALNAEITRLAGVNRDGAKTISAIARAIGLKSRNIDFDQLIKRVGKDAARLPKLRTEIALLKGQIAVIKSAPIRDPAAMALARAENALNEGRLDDADREFALLEALRKAESEESRIAWSNAVNARADVAELRQEFDLAEELRLSKKDFLIYQSKLYEISAWKSAFEAASGRLREGVSQNDSSKLERAIYLYENQVLPLAKQTQYPLNWATTQDGLGRALQNLGKLSTNGIGYVSQSIEAFKFALEVRNQEKTPSTWADTQNNIGNSFLLIGQRQSDLGSLYNAIAAYDRALEVYTPTNAPLEWATIKINRGNAWSSIGFREVDTANLYKAVNDFLPVLKRRYREQAPFDWANAQVSLGIALEQIGQRENGTDKFEQAIKAYNLALEENTLERAPFAWAASNVNRGNALSAIGERTKQVEFLKKAIDAYQLAFTVDNAKRDPSGWAKTQNNLAYTLQLVGESENGTLKLHEANKAYNLALSILRPEEDSISYARSILARASNSAFIAERENSKFWLKLADNDTKSGCGISSANNDKLAIGLCKYATKKIEDIKMKIIQQ